LVGMPRILSQQQQWLLFIGLQIVCELRSCQRAAGADEPPPRRVLAGGGYLWLGGYQYGFGQSVGRSEKLRGTRLYTDTKKARAVSDPGSNSVARLALYDGVDYLVVFKKYDEI